MNSFNWDTSFLVDFNLHTGFSETAQVTKRQLSQMKDMFSDKPAVHSILEKDDPVIYEFYELGAPEEAGHLSFGTTILHPGIIGEEYYMTKGHFHTILDTAEVYYTLKGEGNMVMENPEGDTLEMPLRPGEAIYVPKRYAHRSVNTGREPLIMFFTFGADSGHDYGTIETKGYHKLILEKDGRPAIVDNPHWR